MLPNWGWHDLHWGRRRHPLQIYWRSRRISGPDTWGATESPTQPFVYSIRTNCAIQLARPSSTSARSRISPRCPKNI